MNDYLVIGIDKKENFRAYAAITAQTVEEARRRHGTSATASAALGRTLTAGVLMSANLKGDDLLTIRVLGDGPIGAVVVTSEADANVRGYAVNPTADLPAKNGKLDVGGLIGCSGQLSVTKNMGLRDPYTGSINLVSGEIGDDVAFYYAKSEQIPSVVALGVLVDTDLSIMTAGGFLIQALPDAAEEALMELEQRVAGLPHVTQLLSKGMLPEQLLQQLLGQEFVELQRKPVAFNCRCSKEKLEKILISVGEEEITDIINTQGRAEIKCHFCGDVYYFEADELQEILLSAKK
ncbi:MAG: Hsp33 family molecular chaperone HslO [Thermincola sp.]|jgi:molecular chaperone Hsp33|nr:Hsp33 family molecular chaperone HslO [Thermincola sp.]MDT3701563.1 Hsp33 family molecular chaperone HslO [Thermincola sp.]